MVATSQKEARQPRFPMDILPQTFNLVADHLQALDYDGPVALSCDDTKLFATYRLYWDSEKESYFLVGGTSGAIPVADPDSVKQAIEAVQSVKATKVCAIILFPSLIIKVTTGPTVVFNDSCTQDQPHHHCHPPNCQLNGCASSPCPAP